MACLLLIGHIDLEDASLPQPARCHRQARCHSVHRCLTDHGHLLIQGQGENGLSSTRGNDGNGDETPLSSKKRHMREDDNTNKQCKPC